MAASRLPESIPWQECSAVPAKAARDESVCSNCKPLHWLQNPAFGFNAWRHRWASYMFMASIEFGLLVDTRRPFSVFSVN
jgi:hypothetical protein